MLALKRYPWKLRRAKAREWGKRGHEAKAKLRMEREPSFETLLARAKDDRRGIVLREGHFYRGDGRIQPWSVCWSVAGRSDQFDIVRDGRVWKTCVRRVVAYWLPGLRLPAGGAVNLALADSPVGLGHGDDRFDLSVEPT